MNKSGWLVWRSKFIEWKHETFASTTDLTVQPHFTITVSDNAKGKMKGITFNNIRVNKATLGKVTDLLQLPEDVKQTILNNAVDAWEGEYGDKQEGSSKAKA